MNNAELTRNQLDDLKRKIHPIQQMIESLRPKKKHTLLEYLPDFDQYDDRGNTLSDNDEISPPVVIDSYDNDVQGSLSERLYKEIDGHTTRTCHSLLLVVAARPRHLSSRSTVHNDKTSARTRTDQQRATPGPFDMVVCNHRRPPPAIFELASVDRLISAFFFS